MWINPETQETYIGHSVIRAAFPNISFPADMTESDIAFAGLKPVQPTEPPAHDPATHQAVPAAPVLQGGVWLQQWATEVKPPAPVPDRCHRRQGELALLQVGYLDAVDAAIAAIADPIEKRRAQIEYGADVWERSNPFLQGMWAALGGTPEGLDDLFKLAVTL